MVEGWTFHHNHLLQTHTYIVIKAVYTFHPFSTIMTSNFRVMTSHVVMMVILWDHHDQLIFRKIGHDYFITWRFGRNTKLLVTHVKGRPHIILSELVSIKGPCLSIT